jgi:hypothetical protein
MRHRVKSAFGAALASGALVSACSLGDLAFDLPDPGSAGGGGHGGAPATTSSSSGNASSSSSTSSSSSSSTSSSSSSTSSSGGSGCTDGIRDGMETDVDCGGSSCPKCADGKNCSNDSDCQNGDCSNDKCVSCKVDGVKNGTETDVDCGGGVCPKCAAGKACSGKWDCTTDFCVPTLKVCAVPTCTDGYKNGNETDVDCGGGTCSKCANGKQCDQNSDCASAYCNQGLNLCQTPTCTDGIKNNGETDIDCGGPCPNKCAAGKGCQVDSDCFSDSCDGGTHKCT